MYTYEQLACADRLFGSAYYIFDSGKLKENYRKIHQAFASRYPRFLIGYSYKTNYLPQLCALIDELGGYAEVVSRLEYDLARKIGVDPNRIIYNGPVKEAADIEAALHGKSLLNLDSFYEIELVKRYCEAYPERKVSVGLRVNFDLKENGVNPLQDGFEASRFGFCVENGAFQRAVEELSRIPSLRISGLHGHFSSDRSVAVYEKIARKLCRLARACLPETVEYIDVGGGIYGELPPAFPIPNTPTFDDYAEAVCRVMQTEMAAYGLDPQLILEPGIAMAANAFSFVSKVIDVKEVRGQTFVLVDGSVHNVKPTMHRHNLPHRIVRRQDGGGAGVFHVVGYTCMEKDYLLHQVTGKLPKAGDYFIFENTGAYTMVFNPPFIKGRPPIVQRYENEWLELRGRETLAQFFSDQLYRFEPLSVSKIR
ncbi:diaminopimelate decarboxylase [Brevibacillus sp. B_LB10_24]|uniref:diaminopimelate decarboxylase n=1 Tax=Brevibacillus sp. B_LB10_24 TaxID=3380645 RepID=UPI0038BA4CD3